MSIFSPDEFIDIIDDDVRRAQRSQEAREISSSPEYNEIKAKILAFWSNRDHITRDLMREIILQDWKMRLIPTHFVPYLIGFINSDECDQFANRCWSKTPSKMR